MTNVQSRTLSIREFSIGPAHDPYGASEYCYSCNGSDTILYRDGLYSISVRHNGVTVFSGHADPEKHGKPDAQEEAEQVFAELTGLTCSQFNRAYEKLHPPGFDDFEDPMGPLSNYI